MAGEYIDTTFMDGFVDGPHITEVQTGLANQGLYGPEDYVLEGGREAEAQVLTNNSIRIFDAVYVIQGRRDVIAANDYTDVSIDNGAQEMNRNDIIVRRYTKDESTEIENTEYAVIKGTPVSGEAVDPEVTEGNIRSGATQHDMKLYRVRLEGLNIVAVEPLFKVLYNAETIKEKLDELNENKKDSIISDEYYKDNQTISANSSATIQVSVPVKTGYSRCIWTARATNASSDGNGSSYACVYSTNLTTNDDHVAVGIRNYANVSIKVRVSVRMMYVRNDLL